MRLPKTFRAVHVRALLGSVFVCRLLGHDTCNCFLPRLHPNSCLVQKYPKFKKPCFLNSATRWLLGFLKVSKQLKINYGNSSPLVVEFQTRLHFKIQTVAIKYQAILRLQWNDFLNFVYFWIGLAKQFKFTKQSHNFGTSRLLFLMFYQFYRC